MTRYDDNNPQHRKELMDYLTREESNSKGAFRKFVKDSKNTSPIDQRRVGSNYIYDGGSGQIKSEKQLKQQFDDEQKIKNMKNIKPDPFMKRLANMTEKYDGNVMKVTYNSATGLFTNPDKTIAFKDQDAAHNYNTYIGKGDPPPLKQKQQPFKKIPKQSKEVSESLAKEIINIFNAPKAEPPEVFTKRTESPEDMRLRLRFEKALEDNRKEKIRNATMGVGYYDPRFRK